MFGQGAIGDYAIGQPAGITSTDPTGTGGFNVTGQGATLIHRYPLPTAAGAFVLSPGNVTFTYARKIVFAAGTGAFLVGPKQITGGYDRIYRVNAGAFTLNGRPASLTQILGATPGAFALAAPAAGLVFTRSASVGVGAFSLGAKFSVLTYDHKLFPAAGAYVVSPRPALLTFTRKIVAPATTFALGGHDATLRWNHVLAAPTFKAVPSYVIGRNTAELYPIRTPLRTLDPTAAAYQIRGKTVIFTTNGSHGAFVGDAGPGAFTIGGNSAALRAQRLQNEGTGSLVIAAHTAALTRVYKLQASPTGYSIAPVPEVLATSRKLFSTAGSFVVTGYDAHAGVSRLSAAPRVFVIAEGSAALLRSRKLVAAPGAYTMLSTKGIAAFAGKFSIAGQSATLRHVRPFAAAPGSFALAPKTVTFNYESTLEAERGAFSVNSGQMTFIRLRPEHTAPGAFVLDAGVMTPVRTRKIVAQPGAFSLVPGSISVARQKHILGVAPGGYQLEGSTIGFIEEPAITEAVPTIAVSTNTDFTDTTAISTAISPRANVVVTVTEIAQ